MKKKILVFEADNTQFALLNKQLSDINYSDDDIHRVVSIPEAMKIQPDSINLILAAFNELNKEDLAAIKKLYNRFIHTPIIVFSGNTDADVHALAVYKGAQDVLTNGKYNSMQLDTAIALATGRKGLTYKIEHAYKDYEGHFNSGPIPMWVTDAETMRFILVNNAAVEQYGYTREEFLQMSLLDIRPAEDVKSFRNGYMKRNGSPYDAGYWRHMKKDGTIFHVHVYAHATVFSHVACRLSFIVNVDEKVKTERKNAELADLIKKQKEQLDSILLSISDAIWSRRADTMELVYANNAYYKMFGYEPDEIRKDKELVLGSVYPDDLPLFLKAMDDILTLGKVDIVYRYFHRDGSIKILNARSELKKGSNGEPDMINGVTNDITQEKELYDAIRNSEQKLRATINNTKDLIWSVNTNLEIIFCNEAYQDFVYGLTGIMPEEGNYVLAESTSESFIDTRRKDYSRALEGDSFTTITEEIYKGEKLYLEISSSPIVNHEGRIAGVNCIARDISVQRKQLLKIQQQNEKLKEIAWIQSHKVRGPVATILGLIPLFDYKAAGSEENADLLMKIQTATNDLDGVIREIVFSINALDKINSGPGSETLPHS